MKIASTPRSKRVLVMSSIVVIVAAFGTYLYFNHRHTYQAQPQTPQVTNPVSPDAIQTNPADSKDSPAHTPVQYSPPVNSSHDEQSPNSLSGIINYKSVNNGTLSIRVTIDQNVSSGTCTLVLTSKKTGKTVNRKTGIATNPSSSTCNGFDIPTSELSPGEWSISVKVVSGDQNGNITGSVTV